jgi:hypothetical protein
MPYEPEKFRPRRPVKASRQPLAEEAKGFILETLRWMTCPVTVDQLVDRARDDWAALSSRTTLAALRKLLMEDKVVLHPDKRWTYKREKGWRTRRSPGPTTR